MHGLDFFFLVVERQAVGELGRLQHARHPVDRLDSRDRLRLGCYYVQELTLAETGRLLKEHEATASRQLTRTRKLLREDVERQLRDEAGLSDVQIAECFESAAEDAGPLDLGQLLARKKSAADRSI